MFHTVFRVFFLFKKSCQESVAGERRWVLRELRLSMWILTIRVTWSWNTKMLTHFANVYKCDLFDFDLLWFVCFSPALICVQFLKSEIRKKDGLIIFLRESRESRTSVRLQTVQQIQTGAVWTPVAIQRCSERWHEFNTSWMASESARPNDSCKHAATCSFCHGKENCLVRQSIGWGIRIR